MAVAIGELALTADTLTAANYATTRRRDHDESRVAAHVRVSRGVGAREPRRDQRERGVAHDRGDGDEARFRRRETGRQLGPRRARAASHRSRRTPTAPRRARRPSSRVAQPARDGDAGGGERDPRRDERPRRRRRTLGIRGSARSSVSASATGSTTSSQTTTRVTEQPAPPRLAAAASSRSRADKLRRMIAWPAAPYVAWARTRPTARYDLAASDLAAGDRTRMAGACCEPRRPAATTRGDLDAALTAAIAAHCGVAADHVVTAVGSSGANFLALAALVRPGDAVLVEDPGHAPLATAARRSAPRSSRCRGWPRARLRGRAGGASPRRSRRGRGWSC